MKYDELPEETMTQKLRAQEFDARMKKLIEKLRFSDELPEEGDYKKPYLILFNGITDAIHAMEELDFGRAKRILKYAQYDAEEAFISDDGMETE